MLLHLHLTPFQEPPSGCLRPNAKQGSWTTIYGFAAIAVLILLIACFNYMNLATARAMVRAREISLRKVMGAKRGQLIVQFLGESVLTALVALVLALALVEMLLPAFDSFLARPITFSLLTDWPLTLSVVGVAIAAGLARRHLSGAAAVGLPPGRHAWAPASRAWAARVCCAPPWWCCNSPSPSAWASPRS